MIGLMAGAKIPLILAVQPEITGRGNSKVSPREQTILQELGLGYRQRMQASYAELAQASQQLQKAFPKNVKTLNFYKLDNDFRNGAFSDAVHLTEEGNAVLAERFYRAITSLPNLQLTPPKPPR
jgi:lysophospholipase L1-like esterase